MEDLHDTDYFDAGETKCLDIDYAFGGEVDEGDEIKIKVMFGTQGYVPTQIIYKKNAPKASFVCALDGTHTGTVVCDPDNETEEEAHHLADLITAFISA